MRTLVPTSRAIFEAFTPLFAAVGLAVAGIVAGLLLLVVPGVYLLVRWYFVPQTVVIEGARGTGALSLVSAHPGLLVADLRPRAAGDIAIAVPGLLLITPFTAIAESSDRAMWEVVGAAVTTSVTAPFVALFSTFLCYDLRARAGSPSGAGGEHGAQPPTR
jgi:hypothetical protein